MLCVGGLSIAGRLALGDFPHAPPPNLPQAPSTLFPHTVTPQTPLLCPCLPVSGMVTYIAYKIIQKYHTKVARACMLCMLSCIQSAQPRRCAGPRVDRRARARLAGHRTSAHRASSSPPLSSARWLSAPWLGLVRWEWHGVERMQAWCWQMCRGSGVLPRRL